MISKKAAARQRMRIRIPPEQPKQNAEYEDTSQCLWRELHDWTVRLEDGVKRAELRICQRNGMDPVRIELDDTAPPMKTRRIRQAYRKWPILTFYHNVVS